METATKFNVASSVLFLLGSLAIINTNTTWQTFSGVMFLTGSLVAVAKYLLEKDKDSQKSILHYGHYFFILGALINVIFGLMLSSIILYLLGSITFLLDDILFTFKNWPIFISSVLFCFGSLFLFSAIIPTILVAGICFAVGSFFLFVGNILKIKPEYKVDILCGVGLIVAIEILFTFDFDIETIYDARVNLATNYIALLALLIGIFSNFPQIVHTYFTESVDDFSNWSLILWIFSAFVWFIFSVVTNAYLLLIHNIVSFITVAVILYFKKKHNTFFLTCSLTDNGRK